MEQPINGKLLVRVDKQYKHLNLESNEAHKLNSSTGVVLAVAPDLISLVMKAFNISEGSNTWPKNLPAGEEWIGKKVRWEKYAEQNSKHEIDNPDQKTKDGESKITVTLIDYKDIVSYE